MDLTSFAAGASAVAALWRAVAWRRRRHAIVIERRVPVPMQPPTVRIVADVDEHGEPAPPAWQNRLTAPHQHARREAVSA